MTEPTPSPWSADIVCVCGHARFFHHKGGKCRHYACTCGEFKETTEGERR